MNVYLNNSDPHDPAETVWMVLYVLSWCEIKFRQFIEYFLKSQSFV